MVTSLRLGVIFESQTRMWNFNN